MIRRLPKYVDTHRMFFVKTALQQKPFLSFLSSSQHHQESTTHRHFCSTITKHGISMVFYNNNIQYHGDPPLVKPRTVAINVARSLQQQQQRNLSLSFIGKSSFRLLPSSPSSSSQQIRSFANHRVSAIYIVLFMRLLGLYRVATIPVFGFDLFLWCGNQRAGVPVVLLF